ncbi:MAG: KEOPS complex kinase/ATPase Bud32, partial [Halobacteria archaeon]|nr:KEOPS complex kinase/ATPase Bud32 [Halobacteria archaeon]
VGWRGEVRTLPRTSPNETKGAEATLIFDKREKEVRKERVPKSYRCEPLDEKIRAKRTAGEARLLSEARRAGVPTPAVLDRREATLTMEILSDDDTIAPDISDSIDEGDAKRVGELLSRLHSAGIAHGDPTTRNMVRSGSDGRIYLIDFGLAYNTRDVEDFGMDIHVFEQTLRGTVENPDALMRAFWHGYDWEDEAEVRTRLEDIRGRGRYL